MDIRMNKNHTSKPSRKPQRLSCYDYSTPAWYFVTICTFQMIPQFGKINTNKMIINDLGEFVEECWKNIPQHYPDVELDYYIIMPNHIHGIVIIDPSNKHFFEDNCVGNEELVRSLADFHSLHTTNLSNVIKGFKIGVTKWAKQNNYNFKWQKSFYDRIIRNERELYNIRKYIQQNPLKWDIEKGIDNLDI